MTTNNVFQRKHLNETGRIQYDKHVQYVSEGVRGINHVCYECEVIVLTEFELMLQL